MRPSCWGRRPGNGYSAGDLDSFSGVLSASSQVMKRACGLRMHVPVFSVEAGNISLPNVGHLEKKASEPQPW